MAKRMSLRAGAFIVSAVMAVSSLSLTAAAESQVIEGTFSYSSNEGNNIQHTDSFVFREDCFKHSSFEWCSHLMALSAQTAIASIGRYADTPDPEHNDDPSDEGANILKMLEDMGFSDPEANKYYTVNPQENSVAVAVGHRELTYGGKTYTLLAVFPRSANYKQEWSGNFTVGDGTVHQGFKAARDEALRFLKQYISEHGIQGDLKLWVSGHSRGSAISNLIGAFFAAGGIEYFDGVSIAPEDIFCYTYATPGTTMYEADKKELLSVGGSRGGVYADDTPGEEYVSEASGMIASDDEVFNCIHNFIHSYDFISMLPPRLWNYTRFGKMDSNTGDGAVTPEQMLEQLKSVDEFAYDKFVKGGDYRDFEWKKFDLATLSLVPDTSEHDGDSMNWFLDQRFSNFAYYASNVEQYVSGGMEEALTATAGAYSMLHDFSDLELAGNTNKLILPLVLSFFAYADEMLREDGRTTTEAESVTVVVEELLSYITGQQIEHGSLNVDSTVVLISKYISENRDSKVVKALLDYAANALQKSNAYAMAEQLLNTFVADPENSTIQDKILALVIALSEGPQEGSVAVTFGDAQYIRITVYGILGFVKSELPELLDNGNAPLENLVKFILPLLMSKKDSEGSKYETLAEAADAGLAEGIGLISAAGLENSRRYGELYYEQLKGHIETMQKNVGLLRRMIFRLAFGTWGEAFSTEACIINGATFAGNIGIIPPAHYNEVFVAWGKACEAAGINDHEEYSEPDSSEPEPDSSEPEPDSSEPEPDSSEPESSAAPDDGRKSDNPKTGLSAVWFCGAAVALAALSAAAVRRKKD